MVSNVSGSPPGSELREGVQGKTPERRLPKYDIDLWWIEEGMEFMDFKTVGNLGDLVDKGIISGVKGIKVIGRLTYDTGGDVREDYVVGEDVRERLVEEYGTESLNELYNIFYDRCRSEGVGDDVLHLIECAESKLGVTLGAHFMIRVYGEDEYTMFYMKYTIPREGEEEK